MKVGTALSINVSKIDKARLYKGKNGMYLDCTLFHDTVNQGQYGDNGMIVQSVSKDERAAGVKGAILGNSKQFYTDETSPEQPKDFATPVDNFDGSDIPFMNPYKDLYRVV